MRRGDMAQIEREIEENQDAEWRKLLAMGAAILFGNVASMMVGIYFGWLIWGI